VPALQLVQADEVEEAPKVPAAQSEHLEAPAAEYFPAGHDDTAVSPVLGQNVPAAHVSQAVDAVAAWKVPWLHGVHAVLPDDALYCPAGHPVVDAKPLDALYSPAGARTQELEVDADWYFPALHCVHTLALAAEYWPAAGDGGEKTYTRHAKQRWCSQ